MQIILTKKYFRDVQFGILTKGKDVDKLSRKKDKQKAKEDEKLEKRRQKEEKLKKNAEKEKEREKKKQDKIKQTKGNSGGTISGQSQQSLIEDFAQSDTNRIPLFLEKCVRFIEDEGLDSEGIYRVPGNRAHVELLFQKFEEGKIRKKDFFLFPKFFCSFIAISSNSCTFVPDRWQRGYSLFGHSRQRCSNGTERLLFQEAATAYR